MGFGFLAVVISYLPALYQSFSRRELNISLLDARAGSPPTAREMLRRNSDHRGNLRRPSTSGNAPPPRLLESHISFPVLAYFRSQHDNQSWLSALTSVLDATALCQAGIDGAPARQAQLTFAMARHAVVDLAQVFNTPPHDPPEPRLTPDSLEVLRSQLAEAGVQLSLTPEAEQRLAKLRSVSEPVRRGPGGALAWFQLPP